MLRTLSNIALAFALAWPVFAAADDSTKTAIVGTVHAGGWRTTLDAEPSLYDVRFETEFGPGVDRVHTKMTDHAGRVLMEQTLDYDGVLPRQLKAINNKLSTEASITVTGSEILLTTTEHGKTENFHWDRPPVFAFGPSTQRLIATHLAEIAASKTVEFEMIVPARHDMFGLQLVRDVLDDEPVPEVKSGRWLRIRVEPTNFLYRSMAPKVTMIVDAHSGATLYVIGPVPDPASDHGTIIGITHYAVP